MISVKWMAAALAVLLIADLLTSVVPLRAAHAQELMVPASASRRAKACKAGEGAASRYQESPPYAETRSYVQKVLVAYLTPAAPQAVRRDPTRAPSQRSYSATDAPAEERADPFRQLELIQRNRALAAKPRSAAIKR